MKKYEIMSSTNNMFPVGMEVPIDLDGLVIGDKVQFLTDMCTVTQDKNIIMINRDRDPEIPGDFGAVYTLRVIEDKIVNPYPRKVSADRIDDLRINKEIDLFMETKEIMISPTDRITRAHGVTIEALFEFLKREWALVNTVSNVKFPLEMEENNNLVLWDGWHFAKGSAMFLIEGSWNCKVMQENGLVKIL